MMNTFQTLNDNELKNTNGGSLGKWAWHYVGDPICSAGRGFLSAFG